MAETKVKHTSVEKRREKGKGYRDKTPVSSHAGWTPAPTAQIRSRCLRNRTSPGNRTWYRCVTAGCWSHRSRFTVVRPRSWPPT